MSTKNKWTLKTHYPYLLKWETSDAYSFQHDIAASDAGRSRDTKAKLLTCQIMYRIVQEPLFQMSAGDGRSDAFTQVESLDVTAPGSNRPLPA